MPTRAQITRLQQRIEQTVAALAPEKPRKVIHIIHDCRKRRPKRWKRYLAEHPGDRDYTDRLSTASRGSTDDRIENNGVRTVIIEGADRFGPRLLSR